MFDKKSRISAGILALVMASGFTSDAFAQGEQFKPAVNTQASHSEHTHVSNLTRMVFVHQFTHSPNVAAVFINDRLIGSMPDVYFSETLVCSGKQTVRVDSRAGRVKKGQNITIDVQSGQTVHIEVHELAAGGFSVRRMADAEAMAMEKGMVHTYVLNRHLPACDSR